MEDLAVFTALNHTGSFRKNFVELKKKICYLPAEGRSVWLKTVTEVFKCIFKTSVTVVHHTDLTAGK